MTNADHPSRRLLEALDARQPLPTLPAPAAPEIRIVIIDGDPKHAVAALRALRRPDSSRRP